MNNPEKLYGLILAGGFSRRMGQDKSLMRYHGKPQVEFVYDLLGQFCSKVFLSKRTDQPTYNTIPFINDDQSFSGIGPLGGILSAMKMYPDVSWIVMACDLPFVTKETLQMLLNQRDPSKIATAFRSTHDRLPEPLCALWEGHSYEKILEYFKKGIQCPRKILINGDSHLIEQLNLHWLDNVNDLKEFDQAMKLVTGTSACH